MTVQKTTDIVKIHNDINLFSLGGLSAVEADIFSAICLEIYDTNEDTITIVLPRLKCLCGFKQNNRRFYDALERVGQKLLSMSVWDRTEQRIRGRNIFHKVDVNIAKQELMVKIIPEEKYLFCELVGEYMKYSNNEYRRLPTKYAKAIYRLCSQWRSVGRFAIPIDEFRAILDIPDSYGVMDIDRRVINPAVKELRSIFPDLSVTKAYASEGKKGRPPVSAYIFSFRSRSQYKKHLREAKELNLPKSLAESSYGRDMDEVLKDYKDGIPF